MRSKRLPPLLPSPPIAEVGGTFRTRWSDSILARGGADAMPPESLVDVLVATRRLDEAIEALKGARVRGSRGLAASDTD